jgi:signal peptidase I
MSRSIRRFLAIDLSLLALLVVLLAGLLLTGRIAIVTTDGVSMNPVYNQGDLVVVARRPTYRIGQIVAYRQPGQDLVVLHRIIGGNTSGYVVKGDNNQSTDPTRPARHELIGAAVLHIARGGVWFDRATSPTAVGIFAFLLLAGTGTAARNRRRRRRGFMSRPAQRSPAPAAPPRIFSSAAPVVTVVAGAAAVIGVVALAFGGLAWTRPVQQTVRTRLSVDQQMAFSYQTVVRTSAAYDSTTVTSPDPVFRRLANTVDVHLRYRGEPGSIAVDALLSTAGGWRSRLPLASRTAFGTHRRDAVLHLDLAAIDRRAQRAAAVTGIPASQVDIAVVPRVITAGRAAFAPALHLTLTPLQLSLAGDASSLTAIRSTRTPSLTRTSAGLTIVGRRVSVTAARTLSELLLLGALLVLGLLAALALVSRPVTEGIAIRRHYSPLLVPVHPMPPPVGRPVVEVSDFATLVKVAHRYGLLVMHWSRAGVETFVVQDDAITYRYRTAVGGSAAPDDPTAGWAGSASSTSPLSVDS